MTTQKKVKRPYKGGPGWTAPVNAQGLANLAFKGQATPKAQKKSDESLVKEVSARDKVPGNGPPLEKPQGTTKVDASAKGADVKDTSSKDSGTLLSSGKTVASTFEYLRSQGALVGYKS